MGTAEHIASKVEDAAAKVGMGTPPLIVFTGGEPLLQLDDELLEAVRSAFDDSTMCAVETNGTVAMPAQCDLDWVCVSPKVPVERMVLRQGCELKVVYPDYNPIDYESIASDFPHLFVSPQADTLEVGRSLVAAERMKAAAEFCMKHPTWRLSVQQHKWCGLP
jgi:organic radical activating enzyme